METVLPILWVFTSLLLKTRSLTVINLTHSPCSSTVNQINKDEVYHFMVSITNASAAWMDCIYQAQLTQNRGYFSEDFNYDVNVSIEPNQCVYEVQVYSGPVSLNEPITILSCNNSKINQVFPSPVIYFRFISTQSEEIFDNLTLLMIISYKMCSRYSCPKALKTYTYPFRNTKLGRDHCSGEVCIDDQSLLYQVDLCPTCNCFTFNVLEDVKLCVQTIDRITWKSDADACALQVRIDDKLFMTLPYHIWNYYCLPWELKGRKVTFTFGSKKKNSSLNMFNCINQYCDIRIKTDSRKKSAGACALRNKPSTKKPSIEIYNTEEDSSIDDDEDDYTSLYVIFVIVGVFAGMLWCFCCCKSSKPDLEENAEREVIPNGRSLNYMDRENTRQNPSAPPSESTVGFQLYESDSQQTRHTVGNNINHNNSPQISGSTLDPPPSYEEACKLMQS